MIKLNISPRRDLKTLYAFHLDSEETNQGESIDIYACRVYSYTNISGIFATYTRYSALEAGGKYYITNYEEIENIRID